MPTHPDIPGFGNEWYLPAIEHFIAGEASRWRQHSSGVGTYFLMTKLDAFAGRGEGDYLLSHDIEDLIAVIDGRARISLDS